MSGLSVSTSENHRVWKGMRYAGLGALTEAALLVLVTAAINIEKLRSFGNAVTFLGRRWVVGAVFGGCAGSVAGLLAGSNRVEPAASSRRAASSAHDSPPESPSLPPERPSTPPSSSVPRQLKQPTTDRVGVLPSAGEPSAVAPLTGSLRTANVRHGERNNRATFIPELIKDTKVPQGSIQGAEEQFKLCPKDYGVIHSAIGNKEIPSCHSRLAVTLTFELVLAGAETAQEKRARVLEKLVDLYAAPAYLPVLKEVRSFPLQRANRKNWLADQLLAAALAQDPLWNPRSLLVDEQAKEWHLARSHALVALVRQGRQDEIPNELVVGILDLRDMTDQEARDLLAKLRSVPAISRVRSIFLPLIKSHSQTQIDNRLKRYRAEFKLAAQEESGALADARYYRAELRCGTRSLSAPTDAAPNAAPKALDAPRLYQATHLLPTVQQPAADYQEWLGEELRVQKPAPVRRLRESGSLYLYVSLLLARHKDDVWTKFVADVNEKAVGIGEIAPGLYVGSELEAADGKELRERGISVVINLPGDFRDIQQYEEGERRTISCSFLREDDRFEIIDDLKVDDEKEFDVRTIVEDVDLRIKSGQKVLLQDVQGKGTALTVAVAYLMIVEGKSLDEAIAILLSKRVDAAISQVHNDLLQKLAGL